MLPGPQTYPSPSCNACTRTGKSCFQRVRGKQRACLECKKSKTKCTWPAQRQRPATPPEIIDVDKSDANSPPPRRQGKPTSPTIIVLDETDEESVPLARPGKRRPSPAEAQGDSHLTPAPRVSRPVLDDTGLLRAALADFQEFVALHDVELAARTQLLNDLDSACDRLSVPMPMDAPSAFFRTSAAQFHSEFDSV